MSQVFAAITFWWFLKKYIHDCIVAMAVNDNNRNDQTLIRWRNWKKENVESIVSSIGTILKMFDLVSSLKISLHLSSQNTKHATNINCYFSAIFEQSNIYYYLANYLSCYMHKYQYNWTWFFEHRYQKHPHPPFPRTPKHC